LALRDVAHSNLYRYWAYLAFAQEANALGQKYVRAAVRLRPTILKGMPCELVNHFLINSIDDEGQNHGALLKRIFVQLPPEMDRLSDQFNWAAAQGYLLKGARAVIWGRLEDGRRHFEQAAKMGAQVDDSFLNTLTHQLLDYEAEFGAEVAQDVLRDLTPYLEDLGGQTSLRRLNGYYSVNRAFDRYDAGEYGQVPPMILRAVASNPKYLGNRGVLSALFRSAWGMRPR
jgi:hypothetical protein